MNGETWSKFMRNVFRGDGEALFGVVGADMVREVVAAGLIFILGWIFARRANKRQQKERLVDELIVAERELTERAYPEHWSSNDRRDVWMLNPFLERLKFVFSNIKDQRILTKKQEDLIEEYFFSVEKFLIQWSQTRSRGLSYNTRFQDTFEKLHAIVDQMSRAHMGRLARLRADIDGRTAQFQTVADQFRGPEPMVAAE